MGGGEQADLVLDDTQGARITGPAAYEGSVRSPACAAQRTRA